jgi:UDP:flavonoid glycosyltransferase YjiC (YdhE family)
VKILLVTRGSQGDVYPYLRLAIELKSRGHDVTLSVPVLFEQHAKNTGVPFILQAMDDIHGMLETTPDTKNLLDWTKRIIASQFKEIIPLLQERDLLIASNTEFAAPSIAEYCKKPILRTAYGPFIPSRNLMPPTFPWVKPNPIIKPAFYWGLLNLGLNVLKVKDTINIHRKALGMTLIENQAEHAPTHAYNYLMYSKYFGTVDEEWKYKWAIGGYCFNDMLPYEESQLNDILDFIKKDEKPTVFFSLGSCNLNEKKRDRFAGWLYDICVAHNYKMLVSAGWWNVGANLHGNGSIYHMTSVIPHCKIFPHCTALIHHGGSGTSHSATRSGRPQMVASILLDQFYWAHRVKELGLGPGRVKILKVSRKKLEKMVVDLVTNPSYREKAAAMGELVRNENGLENICKYIENINSAN